MNSLRRPSPLTPGDTVAIIAPASPVSERVLERSVESIRFLGLTPVVFPSCRMHHGYLAGKDMDRANDVNKAFSDPSIKGIFCLRGGYGATRILPLIDYKLVAQNPKIFAGYSDITAMHLAFNQLCDLMTFHAPMPNTGYANMDEFSLKSLKNNLFSDKPVGIAENPEGEAIETIVPGKAEGLMTGGNLSVLQSAMGSPYEVDTCGKILFIEEIGEWPYKLDKMLTTLALAGKFETCAGIVLGAFIDCDPPDPETTPKESIISSVDLSLMEIIDEVITPFQKPTIFNFRAGHIYPQSTIPLGGRAKLNASRGILEFV